MVKKCTSSPTVFPEMVGVNDSIQGTKRCSGELLLIFILLCVGQKVVRKCYALPGCTCYAFRLIFELAFWGNLGKLPAYSTRLSLDEELLASRRCVFKLYEDS
ncbi:hypothetical protein PILCRDRAFT_634052 [Piloderma croceum F 1598]|uniref:Uncharacterized protein n=1 Tax=Piloderma croceum (strain F 1598) TaxID=765440 RepID=A0A0C3BHN7_PILCF|nr:hypothetical protein PILCRDRAFT_634052 [Piloderma croceum F 1598]